MEKNTVASDYTASTEALQTFITFFFFFWKSSYIPREGTQKVAGKTEKITTKMVPENPPAISQYMLKICPK